MGTKKLYFSLLLICAIYPRLSDYLSTRISASKGMYCMNNRKEYDVVYKGSLFIISVKVSPEPRVSATNR